MEEIGERNIRAGSRTDGAQLDAEIVGSESVKVIAYLTVYYSPRLLSVTLLFASEKVQVFLK